MNLTDISIKRPSLIIVMFAVLFLAGIIGFSNLGYELMPDFSQPVVVIRTAYPGAGPEEVQNSVSEKIENALSNVEGVEFISTKSLPNASVVILNMRYGTDLDKTMQDAQRYIDNIRKDLPRDVLNPVMSKVSPNDLPIIQISSTSKLDPKSFYSLMNENIIPKLQSVPGVAELTLLGGEQREIKVLADPELLRYYKVSLPQLSEAINRSGMDIPAGYMSSDTTTSPVRFSGLYKNISQIENIQIAIPVPGDPVYVKDVAAVTDGVKQISSVSRYNGNYGIGILLKKQGDANAVAVSKGVRSVLSELEKRYATEGLHFTVADDSTDKTIAAVDSVVFDLILAVILVALVMILFLRSYRNSLIVMIAIPASLVSGFAAMWMLDYTLNLMTLLAMSLIIGILVDDATVVLENIQRHLDMKKDPAQAAADGRNEIGFSALSITLVDVVVFVPILFLKVFVADMLQQFSVVVVVSTLTSLLVGFTLTPWLASRIGKAEEHSDKGAINRFLNAFERMISRMTDTYARQLNYVLNHKLIFGAGVLLLFILTALIMKQGIIGKELIATGDQGKFRMYIEFQPGTSLKENNITSQSMEQLLMRQPEVESVFSNVGGPGTGIGSIGTGSPHKTEFTVQLKPANQRENVKTEKIMIHYRTELKKQFPQADIAVSALGLIPRSAPVELTLSGTDYDEVMSTGKMLQETIRKIPGADHVQLSVTEGSPELTVVPDYERMQMAGITTAYAGLTLRTAIAGNEDAVLTENGEEYPVRISLNDQFSNDVKRLQSLPIITPGGTMIQLGELAEINRVPAPSLFERKDRLPAVTITAEALGRPSGTVADDVVQWVKQNPLPQGITMTWGSDIKRQHDSFGALGGVLAVSLILVYLIMVALYDSFIYPFVVLFSIPVAAIGAFLALNLTGSHLSLFALLGMIMLMGLVAKNAILIVDFTNQLKSQGKHYRDALIEAGKTRMRPILMTTLSMIIGMLPIALASGTASEWKNGLAWVIIGGLTSSLILTLYLIPVLYSLADQVKEKFTRAK